MPHLESMTEICGRSCQMDTRMRRTRRTLATTLIEILVVIVVLLIGILAVVQIFPKGFQILLLNRNKMVAQSLARDYIEALKSRPDELPEQIVAAHYDNGNLVVDSGKDPSDLSTLGASLNNNGFCTDANGLGLDNWQFITASNIFRRVIGEGRRVPAPRAVGNGTSFFGGLMVLQFGPLNYQPAGITTPSNISVYGNDLQQVIGVPPAGAQRTDYQYFVVNANNNSLTTPTSVQLPTGLTIDANRSYRISFSAYLNTGTGGLVKRDYIELSATVPSTNSDPTVQSPLSSSVSLPGLVGITDPASAAAIVSIDLNTLRIQRFFVAISKNSSNFSTTDPYQYKLLNENLGVLLFNPIGNTTTISRQGHEREPLTARVNYDVYDWRILHDDFRINAGVLPGVPSPTDPQVLTAQHKLPIGSLKVAGMLGVDGLQITPIPILELQRGDGTTDTSAANGKGTDNFVLMDLDTGGVFCEVNTANTTQQLITVDKSTGVITINDLDGDPTNGITGELLLPDGSTLNVQMDNRAVRALYMANQEYSVQVLKAAAQYVVSSSAANLSTGQFYIGGTVPGVGQPWRIYFPQSDNGRKVTVGEVTYLSNADAFQHDLLAQDFLVKSRPDPTLNLPSIDLTDVDPNATAVSFQNGIGARGIKGASVAVRVLWNPTTFRLTPDSATNMTHLSQWQQSTRISTNETFLQKEDINR
jgi:type II secretory pathway pseudopilin PulG